MIKHVGMVVAAALILAAGLATAGLRPAFGQQPEKVTLCHAAGQAGTTHYVTLTIGYQAAFGPAGHFFENGTPRAGHEQDYLGPCVTETTTTTTDTTTTTTTEPEVRELPQVAVVCDLDDEVYRVSATWDGLPATVTPDTIPGDKSGPTLVIVAEGGDTQGFIVNTAGTCVEGETTTTTTTGTTTTTTTEPPPGETTTTGETTTAPEETTTGPGGTLPPPTTLPDPPTTTTSNPPSSQGPPTEKPPSQPTGKPGKPKLPPVCPPGQRTTEPCAVQGNG